MWQAQHSKIPKKYYSGVRTSTYVSTTLFCPESEENVKTPVDFSQLEVLSKYDVILIG